MPYSEEMVLGVLDEICQIIRDGTDDDKKQMVLFRFWHIVDGSTHMEQMPVEETLDELRRKIMDSISGNETRAQWCYWYLDFVRDLAKYFLLGEPNNYDDPEDAIHWMTFGRYYFEWAMFSQPDQKWYLLSDKCADGTDHELSREPLPDIPNKGILCTKCGRPLAHHLTPQASLMRR